uniref:Uncharacterized protein n=1 Tax=Strongyloides papillosus TaxID=174720 RepID=A0A0N5BG50_STREA
MQYLKSNIDGIFDTFNTILKNKNKSQIQPKQISDSLQLLFNYYQNNKICSNNLFDDEFESAIEFYREKLNLRNPFIQNTSKGKANSNGIFYSYLSGKRDYHFVIGQSTFYVCSSLVGAIENMMKINLMMPKFQFTGKTNYLFQLVGLVGSIDHNYLKKEEEK